MGARYDATVAKLVAMAASGTGNIAIMREPSTITYDEGSSVSLFDLKPQNKAERRMLRNAQRAERKHNRAARRLAGAR